ncbi:MAG: methionyl-tRNA formyltransferase [Chloroflexi bacterium]|nr:methionyl-tRNA formyltransferase [Chloroflexota bacterium]
MSVRIVFMGTPQFAVLPLEGLLLNRHQLVAVYTQPDRPAGRGQKLAVSPVKQVALDWHLPVVQPASLKDPEAVAQVAAFHPDVIVVAAYGLILPQTVLDIPRNGCLNIHPSLLPKYRGSAPVAGAILAGDEFAGTTIMRMEAGLDTGPILTQAQIAISPDDTTGRLTEKLSLVSAHLILETLIRWTRGELKSRSQSEAEATYTRPVLREHGEIDWHLPAVDIWRRVRAYHPKPGAYTWWQGKRLKIMAATPLPAEVGLEVGKVVATPVTDISGLAKQSFGVNTGEGILGILAVQLEGKQTVSADEFLRGQRGFVGVVLPTK